jgi:hypothetical protein
VNGIIYVAYGDNAIAQVRASIDSLRHVARCTLPVAVISDVPIGSGIGNFGGDIRHLPFPDYDPGARWAKLSQDTLSPFDLNLYLDSDTRPRTSLQPIFDILADGWDLVIALSLQQGPSHVLWHCTEDDRKATFQTYYCNEFLQLQGGVFGWRKSDAVLQFFEVWRKEWGLTMTQDQGALLRALTQIPLRVWVLSSEWNGGKGALIAHCFGSARR